MTELKEIYHSRINNVFQYIDEHLDQDLSLQTLSHIASFSPFHFHRIFRFITKETLNGYVTRRKIEKAALDLLHKNTSISEVAHHYGFSDNSSFSKTFRKYYGESPTAFKKQNPHRHSQIRPLKSKNGQAYPDHEKYLCIIRTLKNWISMNAKIEIREIDKIDVVFVTSLGPQNLEAAYGKLIQWATPHGLMNEHTKMITIYHDSFKITEANKVRMSASMTLQRPANPEGEVGLTSIAAGRYIVGSFEITLNEFEKSWTGLFLWMNENGYSKSDNPPFEIYHNNFNEHPEKKAKVDFYIPIM
jgi:AraC family transcriptional regulator